MKNLKLVSIGLAVLGLMAATLLIGWFGFDKIMAAALSIGLSGFLIFCAWQGVVFLVLGLGWWVIVSSAAGLRSAPVLAALTWARMVRDSAGCCLPFSQVGGFVLGARAATLHGIPWTIATVTMVVDLNAEFLAEIIFAAAGLLVLLGQVPTSNVATLNVPVAIGLATALGLGILVFMLQKRIAPLFARFGQRLLGDWFKDSRSPDSLSQRELADLYSRTGRLLTATFVHAVGWVGKGIGNWIAFRLLGREIPLLDALAIEGLLHVLLVPAVIVPAYVGAQEAGYAGLGALFGIPPEVSLSVSLLRRARDIAMGVPILLLWQFIEVRRLRLREGHP